MKNCILFGLFILLANCIFVAPSQAGQATFDRGQNPFAKSHFASKAFPIYRSIEYSNNTLQSANVPSQIVISHDADKQSQISIAVLNSERKSSISPSWFYLMMIVALALILLWDDEPIKKAKRKIRYL